MKTLKIIFAGLIPAFVYGGMFAVGSIAFAAIHAGKPGQETVPAASKNKPTCVQSTTIERFIVRDGGKWQRLGGPMTVLSECHA